MEFSRRITHRYLDPLDHVWITCAERIGLRVERTGNAYATSDGRGLMGIGRDADLDADDSVAQMVFHELCHSLVEGPESFRTRDWGLDNETEEHVWREHACLRTQAVLAADYGLRQFFAPTTDFRGFYDALPADPLTPTGESSVALAVQALRRADRPPWTPHLREALRVTSVIAAAVAEYVGERDELGERDEHSGVVRPPLYELVGPRPVPDCLTCGACCREAYHSVTIDDDDPVIAAHPSLIVHRETYKEILRKGDRCAALSGGPPGDAGYLCAIYDDRPRCCRDLERGGEHCLTARRRVGLSR